MLFSCWYIKLAKEGTTVRGTGLWRIVTSDLLPVYPQAMWLTCCMQDLFLQEWQVQCFCSTSNILFLFGSTLHAVRFFEWLNVFPLETCDQLIHCSLDCWYIIQHRTLLPFVNLIHFRLTISANTGLSPVLLSHCYQPLNAGLQPANHSVNVESSVWWLLEPFNKRLNLSFPCSSILFITSIHPPNFLNLWVCSTKGLKQKFLVLVMREV